MAATQGWHANSWNISYCLWRCPWCNGYRRRKWTRWHEFKSWMIAFHIALIRLGKVCWLVPSSVRSQLLFYISLRQLFSLGSFSNCAGLPRTCLSSSTFGLVGDLESKFFVWFRTKAYKGIVCLADHLHSVAHGSLGKKKQKKKQNKTQPLKWIVLLGVTWIGIVYI